MQRGSLQASPSPELEREGGAPRGSHPRDSRRRAPRARAVGRRRKLPSAARSRRTSSRARPILGPLPLGRFGTRAPSDRRPQRGVAASPTSAAAVLEVVGRRIRRSRSASVTRWTRCRARPEPLGHRRLRATIRRDGLQRRHRFVRVAKRGACVVPAVATFWSASTSWRIDPVTPRRSCWPRQSRRSRPTEPRPRSSEVGGDCLDAPDDDARRSAGSGSIGRVERRSPSARTGRRSRRGLVDRQPKLTRERQVDDDGATARRATDVNGPLPPKKISTTTWLAIRLKRMQVSAPSDAVSRPPSTGATRPGSR